MSKAKSWKEAATIYRSWLMTMAMEDDDFDKRGILTAILEEPALPPALESQILRHLAGVPQKEAGDE